MPLVNGGRNLIASALRGTGTDFDGTNARIGVGDSSTAYAATQTDLQAATNKTRVVVDAAPTVTANATEYVATFGDGVAQYAWNEWGVFNSNTADVGMLCRKVESLGTKAAGQTWVATVTLTVTIGT